ncbi:MAG: YcaO-like family protein [Chloroflexota bacterium]|nr:YcaO-like family protein [Chloroflexota bacterium]
MLDITSLDSEETLYRGTERGPVGAKSVLVGTHRVCPPEQTLAHVQPFLSQMGITRVADITQLDDLGIPVFQAIRPNSRNISLSQGKGATKMLAKVSAIMESIESWHAEQPELPSFQARVGDIAALLPYSIYDLNLDKHHLIHDALELEWFPAHIVGPTGVGIHHTFIPANYVRLDFTVKSEWLLPSFFISSNGLASGNIHEEAILHGLYEIIERDTFERVRRGMLQKILIDPTTVDGIASAPILEQMQQAGATIRIMYASGPTDLACFEASIISPSCPINSLGYGCHLDRDVALSRALTEAAQSRLTLIAGARDDLGRTPNAYMYIQSRELLSRIESAREEPKTDYRDTPSAASPSLTADLHAVSRRVLSMVGYPPIVVDLTRKEFNIPVVFVAVPNSLFLETLK